MHAHKARTQEKTEEKNKTATYAGMVCSQSVVCPKAKADLTISHHAIRHASMFKVYARLHVQ